MTTTDAAILGLVQGLTEFLPVSSTAHLLIAQKWLGLAKTDLHLEVAAHLGTILAVVLYYRRELLQYVRETITGGPGRKSVALVVVATGMLAVVFVARKAFPAIKEWRLDAHMATAGLIGVGVFLLGTQFARRRSATPVGGAAAARSAAGEAAAAGDIGWLDAVAMGLGQCVSAIVPGWSRSGSTIGTALFRGAGPEQAAKFSFLMSIPAVLAGALADMKEEPFSRNEDLAGLAIAGGVAFVSGLLAIHALLRIVGRGRLSWFGPYCIAVGVLARFLIV
ncbi:MAG: undecaprenyl-diphosphate phosphatase [Planctomycetes bacterium]|nr:undecaprenyl-diphosphate phosphatase [Planctomycetota bacterium]